MVARSRASFFQLFFSFLAGGSSVPVFKVLDCADPEGIFERTGSRFALVVAAQQAALRTRGDAAARGRERLRLVKYLYRKGLEKEEVGRLFRLMAWLTKLPKDLELKFSRLRDELRAPRHWATVAGNHFPCRQTAFLCYIVAVRTVVYPGSFDPITNGHLDVVQRAAQLFAKVVVAVAENKGKHPLFTLAERRKMVSEAVASLPSVTVDSFTCLLVDYVAQRGAQAIIRGLRAVSDFEFEFQLALINRRLNEEIETIFVMPKESYTFLSSRIVKEICRLGGDVSAFVPPHVQAALKRKFRRPVKNHRRGSGLATQAFEI